MRSEALAPRTLIRKSGLYGAMMEARMNFTPNAMPRAPQNPVTVVLN